MQMQGEYLGKFCLSVFENGHLLHMDDAHSEEECEGQTLSLSAGGDDAKIFPSTGAL